MTPGTPRQQELLRFIYGYQLAHAGASPSLATCAAAIGCKANSNVHRILAHAEARGLVRRAAGDRSIELLVVPTIPTIGDQPLYSVPLPQPRETQ